MLSKNSSMAKGIIAPKVKIVKKVLDMFIFTGVNSIPLKTRASWRYTPRRLFYCGG